MTSGLLVTIGWLRNLPIYQEPAHIPAPTRRSHPNPTPQPQPTASHDHHGTTTRSLQESRTAPRGVPSYPRFSREELEGRFLGLMPYLGPKDSGGQSHGRKATVVFRRMKRGV